MLAVQAEKRLGHFHVAVDFTAPEVGVTALFGRSGAGKTSVVNMVAGLLRPDQGRVRLHERTLLDAGAGIDVPPHRRRLGYVFQDGRLFPHLSVEGNLRYGQRLVPPAERTVGWHQVVDLLGLGALLHRRPHGLSGGEKQRVAVGRALLTSPHLLLMDEPLASLDAARKDEVLPFIARLPRELAIPILYVTHSTDEILQLADLLVVMDQGHTVATGRVEDLFGRLDLQPLTGRYEAGSVLQTTVAAHDAAYGLTTLAFAGGSLHVPAVTEPLGTPLRVRIHARDVGIALAPPEGTSFQNVLRGTVRELAPPDGGHVDMLLDVGCPLWSRITAKARDALGLQPGTEVYALVKSVAITRRSFAVHDGVGEG